MPLTPIPPARPDRPPEPGPPRISAFRLARPNPAPTVVVRRAVDLPAALESLGLLPPRPVLVSVGGASGLEPAVGDRLLALFRDRLAPLLDRLGAAVVDGGTDAGIMALMGRARREAGAGFPLIGVAALGTIRLPGEAVATGVALDPGHSHFALVPGQSWGDEVPWIGAVAAALAHGAGTLTLVSGGGRITRLDVAASLASRRPTLLLRGSGGIADELAAAVVAAPLEALTLARGAERIGRRVETLLRARAGHAAPVRSATGG